MHTSHTAGFTQCAESAQHRRGRASTVLAVDEELGDGGQSPSSLDRSHFHCITVYAQLSHSVRIGMLCLMKF